MTKVLGHHDVFSGRYYYIQQLEWNWSASDDTNAMMARICMDLHSNHSMDVWSNWMLRRVVVAVREEFWKNYVILFTFYFLKFLNSRWSWQVCKCADNKGAEMCKCRLFPKWLLHVWDCHGSGASWTRSHVSDQIQENDPVSQSKDQSLKWCFCTSYLIPYVQIKHIQPISQYCI